MEMLTDIEIAQSIDLKPITQIASSIGIGEEYLEQYGKYKAKIDYDKMQFDKPCGKLVLVTAITPTPAGEGKTTTTIGLADAIGRLGKKAVVALREPSLGPVFGIKGGATGGGYAQVLPMEDINLHFTGDFHAIGAANNLLAAIIDNHIMQGNELDIQRVVWKRCVDMNDRFLREIRGGLGKNGGIERTDGFDITVASEIMAVFCLCESVEDLKNRLAAIIVGYDSKGNAVTAGQLKAVGAMAALLKDAIKPNLVQTIEGTPAIIHGGPFANIAHGCNSVIATKLALKLGDYAITEAGFGGDLGAEKFFDIKCRSAKIKPNAVVVVATVRALKMHGGVEKEQLAIQNLQALEKGIENLLKHVSNVINVYKLPCVVAINRFYTDTQEELLFVKNKCAEFGVKAVLSNVWEEGGKGALCLAEEVIKLCNSQSLFSFCYEDKDSIEQKIEKIVCKVYGGKNVHFTDEAKSQLKEVKRLGGDKLPVCIAKTQYSLSDDPLKLGAPKDFTVTVKGVKLSAGAGFIVVFTGAILTMPGLPKNPAAERIDVNSKGKITGLF
ncbi:MAG: formate--tetrahydrofolate ligase [Clostridia bacterium]|nr:formate--tetrahydrofolate ligase [Clostridia bacterium]